MCKVYNTVGSLTVIKQQLAQNKITDFNSTQELLSFQNHYSASRDQIISGQRLLLTAERDTLAAGILELEKEMANDSAAVRERLQAEVDRLKQQYDAIADITKSWLQEFLYSFQALFLLVKIRYKELTSHRIIAASLQPKVNLLAKKRERHQYLVSHLEECIIESGRLALHALDHKKRVIDEINSFIYGAIGEQKVVEALRPLPDEYLLINDFSYSFSKAIYYGQEKSYIKTIQIDHLLISPAGIFLIETKNWSKESLQNLSLFSPVQQINRTNYALFKLVSENLNAVLDRHHWGERKIPIRNLIVLINHKPAEEFQYVKILTLDELPGYVEYFKPSLSKNETQEIADYLIRLTKARQV